MVSPNSQTSPTGRGWIKPWLRRFAVAHPSLAIRVAGAFGRWSPLFRMVPSEYELSTLFPDWDTRRVRKVRRRIGGLERRNQALLYILNEAGIEPVIPMVDLQDAGGLEDLRGGAGPTILVLWHAGVPQAELPALVLLETPVVVADYPTGYAAEFVHCYPIDTPSARVVFLKNALSHLRQGGMVLLNIDGSVGEGHLELPFLGQRVHVGRGAGTLARLSGAQLVPMTCRWGPAAGRIEVRIHPALSLPEVSRKDRRYEEAVLTEAARWFETYLRENPEQLRRRWLRGYLAAGSKPVEQT